MRDKMRTLETKRARRAKRYAPKFNIRALEAELRKENQHVSSIDFGYRRNDYRISTTERNS